MNNWNKPNKELKGPEKLNEKIFVKEDSAKAKRAEFRLFFELCFKTLFPNKQLYYANYLEVIFDRLLALHKKSLSGPKGQETLEGKINRLIVNMPPRFMKSLCVSVVYPAWVLGKDPSCNIIVASYSGALAIKHSLDTRFIITSDWYKKMFPATIINKDQNTKAKFQTTERGFRLATSTGGTLTGEGADLLIADDPLNAVQANSPIYRQKVQDWFAQTFMPRLNNRKNSSAIIVMQRLHEDDLCGSLIRKMEKTEKSKSSRMLDLKSANNNNTKAHFKWHILALAAIAEEEEEYYSLTSKQEILQKNNLHNSENNAHDSNNLSNYANNNNNNNSSSKNNSDNNSNSNAAELLWKRKKGDTLNGHYLNEEDILELQEEIGSYSFAAQYQQQPIRVKGGLVKKEWFKQYFSILENNIQTITQSWDTALGEGQSSDYSVCITFAKIQNAFYILDIFRGRLNYPELKKQVKLQGEKWQPHNILIENKSSGQTLIQELKFSTSLPVITINVALSKLDRFYKVIGLLEGGRVYLPEHAPWLAEFEYELFSFPNCKNDDQIDSFTQYLNYELKKTYSSVPYIRGL